MLRDTLGIGIIGCGRIAQTRHIPEYAENDHSQIVGFCDYSEKRANELAAKYNATAFSSAQALLSCKEIDAVSICTANHTHAELTIAALQAGKHVLCEKPMAIRIEECEQMADVAKASGKTLMIAHNQRLWELHKKARDLLEEGVIGRPLTFRSCFGHSGPDNWSIDPGTSNWFFDKKQSAFGVIADLGVHKTDLICYLLNSEIEEVKALSATLDKRYTNGEFVAVEDNAICLYRMKNGILGSVTVSWTYYGEEDNDTVIYGSDGIMRLISHEQTIIIQRKNGETISYKVRDQKNSGVIDAFIRSIIHEEPSPISVEAVLPSMRAVFAAIESATATSLFAKP